MARTPTGDGAVYLYETVGLGDRDPTGQGAVYFYETVGLGDRDPTGDGAVYLYENVTGPPSMTDTAGVTDSVGTDVISITGGLTTVWNRFSHGPLA